MRQNNLALLVLLLRLLTLWVIHRERAHMCCHAGEVLGFHAAERHSRADDGLLVGIGNISACEDHAREDHPGVGRVGPDLGEFAPGDRVLDPGRVDDGDHHGLGLGILIKVDRIGYDVGGLRDADLALAVGLEDLGAMFLDNVGELQRHELKYN